MVEGWNHQKNEPRHHLFMSFTGAAFEGPEMIGESDPRVKLGGTQSLVWFDDSVGEKFHHLSIKPAKTDIYDIIYIYI